MKPRHDEVIARLRAFEKLERKNTDEAGWIALAYSCTRAKAERLIAAALDEAKRKGART